VKKFALTGGDGAYELRGQYDAGSKVFGEAVRRDQREKTTRRLPFDEPQVRPAVAGRSRPAASSGTVLRVSGMNLDFIPVIDGEGNVTGHILPSSPSAASRWTGDGRPRQSRHVHVQGPGGPRAEPVLRREGPHADGQGSVVSGGSSSCRPP